MTYFGKYRGTVVNNRDPRQLGRLQVSAPDVAGMTLTAWASPCLPPGALPVLPEVDDPVWVEFERGDPDFPIWCGVYWTETSRVPEGLRGPAARNTLSLRTEDGAGVTMGPTGIVIDNGKGASIVLTGPAVSINGGALEII